MWRSGASAVAVISPAGAGGVPQIGGWFTPLQPFRISGVAQPAGGSSGPMATPFSLDGVLAGHIVRYPDSVFPVQLLLT